MGSQPVKNAGSVDTLTNGFTRKGDTLDVAHLQKVSVENFIKRIIAQGKVTDELFDIEKDGVAAQLSLVDNTLALASRGADAIEKEQIEALVHLADYFATDPSRQAQVDQIYAMRDAQIDSRIGFNK